MDKSSIIKSARENKGQVMKTNFLLKFIFYKVEGGSQQRPSIDNCNT